MGTGLIRLAVSVLWFGACAAPTSGGLTVTSYSTTALTNAFSPVGSGQYFQKQTLTNVSPATASVSGDWTGPNADGTPDTWHWVGQSQVTSSTAFDANTLTVTAAGSFAYELDTTAGFVDPRSASVFTPAGAANYETFFEPDSPATFMVTVQLNPRGRVRLSSFEGFLAFDRSNHTDTPMMVSLTGTLPVGRYDFLATTSLGAPNFPNGVNHFDAHGSYENLTFTVQVPEPGGVAGIIVFVVGGRSLRRRQSRER